MKTTTSYSVAVRTDIPLAYRCEHCGRDVRMAYPLRTEYGVASPGSAAATQGVRGFFEQTAADAVFAKQQKEAAELGEGFNANFRYWVLDGFISAGKCPYCKKKQTWRKLAAGGEGTAGGWIGGLASFLLGIAVCAVGSELGLKVEGLTFILIAAAFTAAGIIVGKAQGKKLENAKKAKFEEWLKSAPPEQVPRLLVEQRSPSRFIDAGLRGMDEIEVDSKKWR